MKKNKSQNFFIVHRISGLLNQDKAVIKAKESTFTMNLKTSDLESRVAKGIKMEV